MADPNPPIDESDFDVIERPESPYAALSDRALLERMALQVDTTTQLANGAIAQLLEMAGPILNDPKLKLMLKFLPKG